MQSAIGYIRVSTGKQEKSGLGLEAQRDKIRAWSEYSGNEIIRIYEDVAVSGNATEREELNAAIEDAIKNKRILVVYDLDRITRKGALDALEKVETLKNGGAGLVILNLGIDTTTPTGKFMLTVMAGFAELERKKIGERTRLALKARAEQGKLISRLPPPGTRLNADGTYDPDGSGSLDYIREQWVAGNTANAIAKQLNELGYPAHGKKWYNTTVEAALKYLHLK